MAKLSARGRYKLIQWQSENDSPDSNLISYERRTYALMSDRRVLRKIDVQFKGEGERKHSYGWKLFKRFPPDTVLANTVELYRTQIRESRTYTEVPV